MIPGEFQRECKKTATDQPQHELIDKGELPRFFVEIVEALHFEGFLSELRDPAADSQGSAKKRLQISPTFAY